MSRPDVVAIARETLGSPYGHQGRINGVALDCAGVPIYVARRLGLDVDEVARYGKTPNPMQVRSQLSCYLRRVPLDDIQAGDVVWLRFEDEPQHLAVVGDYPLGGHSLIHAYNSAGLNRVVEHRMDAQWRGRIFAVWRLPEMSQ